jgi:hypothetical protein
MTRAPGCAGVVHKVIDKFIAQVSNIILGVVIMLSVVSFFHPYVLSMVLPLEFSKRVVLNTFKFHNTDTIQTQSPLQVFDAVMPSEPA